MSIMYKIRLGHEYEVLANTNTGYYELYKDSEFMDASDDITVITHNFNNI